MTIAPSCFLCPSYGFNDAVGMGRPPSHGRRLDRHLSASANHDKAERSNDYENEIHYEDSNVLCKTLIPRPAPRKAASPILSFTIRRQPRRDLNPWRFFYDRSSTRFLPACSASTAL